MITTVLACVAASVSYTALKIEGWTIRVERPFFESAAWKPVRQELSTQLYRITHVVPDAPLAKLRKIPIWVHRDDPGTQCMAYHPGAEWLSKHGMNPQMEHGIEIGNGSRFVEWCYEQPWMVLHELAHGYHQLFLPDGYENKQVKAVWDAEMASKRYDEVLHWDGKNKRHYATTNPMEFFAECTEAYFGQNDFYPFVNAELKTFDSEAYSLMESVWGKPQKRVPRS